MADISKITTLDGTTYDIKDATARNNKIDSSEKGSANGVATLNSYSLIPTTQLPPMVGATSSASGSTGAVPMPTSSDAGKFLRGDGTWADGGRPMVILSYGNSTWQDFINAYNNNVIVYCRASSNSNPASGAQTRMAFMAYVNANPPTQVEFQYYRSVSSHSDTQMCDQVFIYTLNSSGTWSVTTREAGLKQIQTSGNNISATYSDNAITLSVPLESKTAASSGTDVSLVTTGEKYTWNNKGSGTITGITMNGASVGTSGIVDLGTVVTDISGKADKSGTVLTGSLSRGRKTDSASGTGSFAFGTSVVASGDYSFAQGNSTASGPYAHAEGSGTTASGSYSHAEGRGTIAYHSEQHAGGAYNVQDPDNAGHASRGTYIEIIGNGTTASNRSNARALDWDGNEYLNGDLFIKCDSSSANGISVNNMKISKVHLSSVSSLPKTYSVPGLLDVHEVIKSELSVPEAQGSDWTVTTSTDSLTISGTFIGTSPTSITLYFAIPSNATATDVSS